MINKWLVTEANLEEMVSGKPLTSSTICGGYYRTNTSSALWVGRLRREQRVKGRQEAAARWEGERKRKWGEQVQGYEIIQEEQVRTYIGISTLVSVERQVKLPTFGILKNFDCHKYRVSENNRGVRLDIGTYLENLTSMIYSLIYVRWFRPPCLHQVNKLFEISNEFNNSLYKFDKFHWIYILAVNF